ncbi:hypothetical protein M422DRAFT_97176, partial [Sphaerobolus stellatus SS14]
MLTEGRITPLIHQNWSLACRKYMKHAEKKPSEIVSFVAEGMMEPRLVAWYYGDQARIDSLSLAEYLEELVAIVLEKGWEHKIKQQILSARQEDEPFLDWKIELENLNAILFTSAPTLALTKDALKNQLDANL